MFRIFSKKFFKEAAAKECFEKYNISLFDHVTPIEFFHLMRLDKGEYYVERFTKHMKVIASFFGYYPDEKSFPFILFLHEWRLLSDQYQRTEKNSVYWRPIKDNFTFESYGYFGNLTLAELLEEDENE